MLSVGRELYIGDQQVLCRSCQWEGTGNQLGSGLIQTLNPEIFLYAYKCPACESFDTDRKGRLLEFRFREVAQKQDGSDRDRQPKESPRNSKEYTINGNRRA